ncbi:TetR family transcriptional regulator [Mycobacterium sp. E3298]|uniref:TetR/AcrR family transcriptional regulator n=1 Tax=Mycobacterium sp. E3298 TaxID=1856865 RepID=UPI0009ED1AB5|nr:TetR family transcriptional regulator [Mycobacterium sp. E3298]
MPPPAASPAGAKRAPGAGGTQKRRGRRQGEPVSKDVVLRAAKRRFAAQGFEKTTLRQIADDAHVDAAMVLYLFGSKAELFRESMRLILDGDVLVAAMTDGPREDVGVRLVRAYLRIWEEPETGPTMVAMLHSAMLNSDAYEAFREFMRGYVMAAISGVLGEGPDTVLRANLAGTNLVGTALFRYVMRVGPLAELRTDEVVALIAPSVQRYLTGDADELDLPAAYRP